MCPIAAMKFDATATFKVSAQAEALQGKKIVKRLQQTLCLVDLCKLSLSLYSLLYNEYCTSAAHSWKRVLFQASSNSVIHRLNGVELKGLIDQLLICYTFTAVNNISMVNI